MDFFLPGICFPHDHIPPRLSPGINNFAAEGYLYLDTPSIQNYNIASCSPHLTNFDKCVIFQTSNHQANLSIC
jgi:hypothetical protein